MITLPRVCHEADIDRALCRSLLYDLLACCFRAPDQQLLERLVDASRDDSVGEAAWQLSSTVGKATQMLAAQARVVSVEELKGAFVGLFGHTAHGRVPPYETEYGSDDVFQQSSELADISGFYRAFGLALSPSQHERPDHIAAEFELLSFLACKEAYEWIEEKETAVDAVRQATRLFIKEHLGRFGRAFARNIDRETEHSFYRAVAGLCLALLEMEHEAFGLPRGPDFIKIREGREDDVPMACGSICPLGHQPPAE